MKKLIILLWLSLLINSVQAQNTIEFPRENGTLTMAERMAQEDTKGVAIAVMLDGQLILNEQWGFADADQEKPVTEQTVFQVGSMSQPVANFVVLRLVEQGVFDLDTDINTYLTSWLLPTTRVTRKRPVTIRDLCLQRRGFKFPYKPDGYLPGTNMPTHLQLLNGDTPAPNEAVVLRRDLNKNGNNSYAPALILQQLLMDHYGQSFEQIAQEQVFEPLGMTHSFYASNPSPEQAAHIATGYDRNKQALDHGYQRYAELSASGLYTTPTDYARFIQACLDALTGRDDRFMSQALAQQALQPEHQEQGLLFNQSENEFFWGGATPGFYTQFAADAKAHRWVVVVFMNDDLNWSFNGELRSRCQELARSRMSSAASTYQQY